MQGARSLARIFATGNVMLFVNRPGRWDATRIEQGGIALIYNHTLILNLQNSTEITRSNTESVEAHKKCTQRLST